MLIFNTCWKHGGVTFQMLWPAVTINCGNQRPQIASLWPQKCCSHCPQQTVVAGDRKWSVCDINLLTKMANLATLWRITQFVVSKAHNIFKVTERLFTAGGWHSLLCPKPTTFLRLQRDYSRLEDDTVCCGPLYRLKCYDLRKSIWYTKGLMIDFTLVRSMFRHSQY